MFAGKTLTLDEVFFKQNIGTPFIRRNYSEIIGELEKNGVVSVDRPPRSRPIIKGKFTYGKNTRITFPAQGLGHGSGRKKT
jgi:hypothetical protein